MREDLLTSVLAELNATSADIEACAVLSTDGLMIASMLPQGLDPDRVGAMGRPCSRSATAPPPSSPGATSTR